MDNSGEIRRVLGKSQKKITSIQKEIKTNKDEEKAEIEIKENNAVSELATEIENNSPNIFQGNLFVIIILPIILLTVVFFFICVYTTTTKKLTATKTIQNEQKVVEQTTKKVTKEQPVLNTTKEIDKQENPPANPKKYINTYDAVMQHTNTSEIKKNETKPTQNSQSSNQASKQIQNVQPPKIEQTNTPKPTNQYKDKSVYLKDVKRILSESYKPQYPVGYSKLEIDYTQGKVISREGDFSGGSYELYGYLLMKSAELPIYYKDGKACSVMVTVNDSVITDVTLVE